MQYFELFFCFHGKLVILSASSKRSSTSIEVGTNGHWTRSEVKQIKILALAQESR